jgi:hypothetical protein
VSAYFCSFLLVVLIRNMFPPTAVYLATSNIDRLKLLQQLQARSIPNLVALLTLSRSGTAPLSYRFISLFDFRTHNDDTWRTVVDQLLAMAPVIFVDARDASPGVLDEVRRIIHKRYLNKVLFVSNPDGSLPVLESLAPPHDISAFRTLDENQLLKRVTAITWGARKK